MAMGRRTRGVQRQMWISAGDIPESTSRPFYAKLNEIFDEEQLDTLLEKIAQPFYARVMGRPSLAPGVYFRMVLLGFFENYRSDRSIAWHVDDSKSHRAFLGLSITEKTPNHSTLSNTRRLLPVEFHEQAFSLVVAMLYKRGLIKGKAIGIDGSTMEANASLKSLERRDTGETYNQYVKRLAEEAGETVTTTEELIRFDKKRKPKKMSNGDWVNPHDPDAKVARMKSGATDMAYKPEHAVDLESGALLAATINTADQGDTTTGTKTLDKVNSELAKLSEATEDTLASRENSDGLPKNSDDNPASTSSNSARQPAPFEPARAEVVMDKGYHKGANLADMQESGWATYVCEPDRGRRTWTDKDGIKTAGKEREQNATYANRRRIKGKRGKELMRRRGELVERSFAHVLDTGGMRRTYLKGLELVQKRYLIQAAAFNLSLIMRQLLGSGKPREAAGRGALASALRMCFFEPVSALFAQARATFAAAATRLRIRENSRPVPHAA